MRIVLAAGRDGLLAWREGWTRLPCPLAGPTQVAAQAGRLAVADETRRLLWTGDRLLPIDGGLEALALWRGRPVTLSGETDSLTVLDPFSGQPQMLTPAGVYPQDLCFVSGDMAAVCSGSDGRLRLIRMSDLRTVREFQLSGATQRVACMGHDLAVLCLTGDAELHTLLWCVPLSGSPAHRLCAMPGLPGALCPDGRGGVWMAVTECLAHIPRQATGPDLVLPGFGLIRHLERLGSGVLASDPVLGTCTLVQAGGRRQTLFEGDVYQAIITG